MDTYADVHIHAHSDRQSHIKRVYTDTDTDTDTHTDTDTDTDRQTHTHTHTHTQVLSQEILKHHMGDVKGKVCMMRKHNDPICVVSGEHVDMHKLKTWREIQAACRLKRGWSSTAYEQP